MSLLFSGAGDVDEDEEVETESSHSSCPAYAELLEVMERAMERLDLPWKWAKKMAPWGNLDECYLSDHSPPAQVSLPFISDQEGLEKSVFVPHP